MKPPIRRTVLLLASIVLAGQNPPSAAAAAQGFISYRLASPAGCGGRVPDHPSIPVPRDYTLQWSGSCVGGWMEGTGELKRFRDGQLVERELTQMRQGIRNGSDASFDVDPSSGRYGSKIVSRWRNGFPYGEIRAFSAYNTTLNVWEADGRGGMVQTMNPLDPILRAVGREMGPLPYFLRLFAPRSLENAAVDRATCQAVMSAQGFTSETSQVWCGR
jgi:hypothetical protein